MNFDDVLSALQGLLGREVLVGIAPIGDPVSFLTTSGVLERGVQSPAQEVLRGLGRELLTATPAATASTVSHPPAVADDRRRRYFAAALRAELAAVSAAQPGTRNNSLNRAAFRLAQLADDETDTLDELQRQLLGAALTAGLSEPEAHATIASGLAAGQQHRRR